MLSCMAVVCQTIDPRIPAMSGRSKSSFDQPDENCSRQARTAVRISTSRIKGQLHPTCQAHVGACTYLFLPMDDRIEQSKSLNNLRHRTIEIISGEGGTGATGGVGVDAGRKRLIRPS